MSSNQVEPCCDYRDHNLGWCACPDHPWSVLHPFGDDGGTDDLPPTTQHNADPETAA